ncbi:MAG: response regulator transcription factor [Magnetospirillum sp. WYHS-4]
MTVWFERERLASASIATSYESDLQERHAVILVGGSVEARARMAGELEGHALSVAGVPTAFDLFRSIATQDFAVAIVDQGLAERDGAALVADLRQASRMAIVLLCDAGDPDGRIKGYEAGADLCLVQPACPRELTAAVRSLASRRSSQTVAVSSVWICDLAHWNLAAPNGKTMRLTSKEKALVETLLAQPGETVRRSTILHALAYPENSFGNRALDALVRRLRRKAFEEAGQELPVQTVYGLGYLFSAPARML